MIENRKAIFINISRNKKLIWGHKTFSCIKVFFIEACVEIDLNENYDHDMNMGIEYNSA